MKNWKKGEIMKRNERLEAIYSEFDAAAQGLCDDTGGILCPELGEALLVRMAEELGNAAIVEKKPKLEGRNMTMIVAPKSK